MLPLILASSSSYRQHLLKRLQIPFQQHSEPIDETPYPLESANELAVRLATEKSQAIASKFSSHLIIGSDQVACLGSTLLNKPLTTQKAFEQLSACSGQHVTFFTGIVLFNTKTQRRQVDCICCNVYFRSLNAQQITRYIEKEKPLNCAGSFKVEGLGISLFKRLEGDDINSLIGLPLIRLTDMLLSEGYCIP
ncbi:UNVERIFIED_CONTAM: hypothetical protein GTU68_066252 [Idotea baltica]|nr:hypothetical protein [Idotea baltica]